MLAGLYPEPRNLLSVTVAATSSSRTVNSGSSFAKSTYSIVTVPWSLLIVCFTLANSSNSESYLTPTVNEPSFFETVFTRATTIKFPLAAHDSGIRVVLPRSTSPSAVGSKFPYKMVLLPLRSTASAVPGQYCTTTFSSAILLPFNVITPRVASSTEIAGPLEAV